MNIRSRSIRRELLLRMMFAGLAGTLVVGSVTYWLERQRVAAAVEERTALAVELLRAKLHRLAPAVGQPWQQALPQALAELRSELPAAELGRFAALELVDNDGRVLADANGGALDDSLAVARQLGLDPGAARFDFARIHDGAPPGAWAVALAIADRQGARLARVNGVFVVAPAVIAQAERRLAWAVSSAAAIVAATTLLLYPLIRRLVRRLSDLATHLLDANLETLQVLGSAIAKRDSDTDAHNYRVTIYAVRLAEAQGVGNAVIRRLIKGAFLHDVGKIGVRDDVLLKPGRLDEREFEIMKTHVTHGLDIIARSAWLRDAGEVIGGHHEKFAGQGYHRGLQGRAIPLTARIFAIADVFDALSSERPYKQPMPVAECIATLQQGAGPHFDPELVARFAAMAVDLHARFANDYEAARKELAGIVERYFRADPAVMSDVIDPGD